MADDSEIRDELPGDLDTSGFVGPYVFPNNNRRRVAGTLYLAIAAVCVVVWLLTRDGQPVLVNGGILVAGIALGAVRRLLPVRRFRPGHRRA